MKRSILWLLALGLLAGTAQAGSWAEESLAIGFQTETADLVALASFTASEELGRTGNLKATFAVTETIRGDVKAGESIEVLFPKLGTRPPWVAGKPHLLFVSRRPDRPDFWYPVSGPVSIRAIPETGPVARIPELARKIAATLATESRPADPEALKDLLVKWMEDREPGVAWSAALDFIRREDLHPRLTDADRRRILGAFVGHPIGKASKDALAMAVATARPEGAGAALVDSLLLPQGRMIRGTVADALAILGDPEVPGYLAGKLKDADARTRADLLLVLGGVGGEESVDVARKHVTDSSPEVRLQAAHALGRIARRVREEKPDAVVAGREELFGMLGAARGNPELQAALWALAQLQDPEAVKLLTRLEKEDSREFVRTWAKRYRDRPRLSLILR